MKKPIHLLDGDMELKKCTACKKWRHILFFHKDRSTWDGLDNRCKSCKKEYQIQNKDKYRNAARRYKERHPERILEYVHTHKQDYVDYRNSHKQQISNTKNIYQKNKKKTNIQFHLLSVLRTRLGNSLRRNSNGKAASTKNLLGCTIDELKTYLESLFSPDMSWDNYGIYWEIDHIRPCRSFDLSKSLQQQECFHWSNLQPLEKSKNRAKNDKFNGISARCM